MPRANLKTGRKICSKCRIEKSINEFYRSKIERDGFNHQCTKCYTEDYHRRARISNPLHDEYVKKISIAKDNLSKGLKTCGKCHEVLELEKFYITGRKRFAGGVGSICVKCEREKGRELRKTNPEYNQKNRDRAKAWALANPDRARQRSKNANNKRYKEDQYFRFVLNLRGRQKLALTYQGTERLIEFNDVLGCTPEEARSYIQSKFSPGMNWENHGDMWHIDHIAPCSMFDLTKPLGQRICFHYLNLQPLFIFDNLSKHASLTDEGCKKIREISIELLPEHWKVRKNVGT